MEVCYHGLGSLVPSRTSHVPLYEGLASGFLLYFKYS